jgi:trypsin
MRHLTSLALLTIALCGPAHAIVGGQETLSAEEFPYIVSIGYFSSHICAGVLINVTAVLTAASCLIGRHPATLSVRAGSLTHASGGSLLSVSAWTGHPAFNHQEFVNNIAVMTLSQSAPFGPTIQPAKLPSLAQAGFPPRRGARVTMAGWGWTTEESGPHSATLRDVESPVVTSESCSQKYEGQSPISMAGQFCAGVDAGGIGACHGDSGGPVVDECSGTVVGIISHALGCAQPNYPQINVYIGHYLDWIAGRA